MLISLNEGVFNTDYIVSIVGATVRLDQLCCTVKSADGNLRHSDAGG